MEKAVKIDIPCGDMDFRWAVELPSGEVEIWGQNISSHPWKSREYPSRLLETITGSEFTLRRQRWQVEAAVSDAVKAVFTAKAQAYDTWVNTLPVVVSGFTIDFDQQGIVDSVGNYLFSLPAAMPLVELEAWLVSEFAAWAEYS